MQKVQHQFKLHIVILDFDLLKDNGKFSKPMICENMASRKIFRHFLQVNFMFLLLSNHTFFLVQFEKQTRIVKTKIINHFKRYVL